MTSYKQPKNEAHRNISDWLFTDEFLYEIMIHARYRKTFLKDATKLALRELPPETPDGVRYSYSGVYAAMRTLSLDDALQWAASGAGSAYLEARK